MTYLFEAKADFRGMENNKFEGVYRVINIIPIPKNNKQFNAVSVILMANQESDIRTFSNFENSCLLSDVWSSFRYIE